MKPVVCITDAGFENVETERQIVEAAGCELRKFQCVMPEDVIAAAKDADVLIAQWAPINADVLRSLSRCRGVVRYGIGVDNIDLHAAKAAGIPVANVPDYCIDEVADHALAFALALVRQLPGTDARVRSGEWKIVPPVPMPAMRNMLFATAGFGRIARAVLQRARVFGCQVAAYDPYVSDAEFSELGVCRLGLDEVFEAADIVSLHLPLVPETRQLVNRERLGKMKPHAVLINTARGGLIDTCALAEALSAGRPGFAGLDVFETEPVEPDHPLRSAPNVLLTSHTAWYSSASVKELQRLAAEEAVRCLRGEPFKNPVIH